jgi:hypothetical protein
MVFRLVYDLATSDGDQVRLEGGSYASRGMDINLDMKDRAGMTRDGGNRSRWAEEAAQEGQQYRQRTLPGLDHTVDLVRVTSGQNDFRKYCWPVPGNSKSIVACGSRRCAG